MTDKPAPLAFKPAPRPTPRVSADVAAQLADANADLGFTRASSPPPEAAPAMVETPAFQPAPRPAAKTAAAPAAAPRRRDARPIRPSKGASPSGSLAALKLDIPEALWTTLRIEAVKRRITVKYLVLEALAAQGYLDLTEFQEDGRRLR